MAVFRGEMDFFRDDRPTPPTNLTGRKPVGFFLLAHDAVKSPGTSKDVQGHRPRQGGGNIRSTRSTQVASWRTGRPGRAAAPRVARRAADGGGGRARVGLTHVRTLAFGGPRAHPSRNGPTLSHATDPWFRWLVVVGAPRCITQRTRSTCSRWGCLCAWDPLFMVLGI